MSEPWEKGSVPHACGCGRVYWFKEGEFRRSDCRECSALLRYGSSVSHAWYVHLCRTIAEETRKRIVDAIAAGELG